MTIVYSLQSISNPERYYIGITDDEKRRLEEHNLGKCHHTAKYAPWKLVVSVHFLDAQKAMEFERYLKTGSGRAFAKKHF